MVKFKLFFIVLSVFSITACQREVMDNGTPKYPVKISITNKAGTNDLVLNGSYTNPFGEPIKITNFKYYLSNFSLVTTNGTEVKVPDSYILTDQRVPSSLNFSFTTEGAEFKAVKFFIGIDSARNVSGVQTGALDPANGMFWTWNSGYIMAKLEGISAVSTEPLSALTWHIGGFKTGENTVRQVALNLPANLLLSNTDTSELQLTADAMKWFNGVEDVKISNTAYCTSPGNLAVTIANNYATMFAVQQVINR